MTILQNVVYKSTNLIIQQLQKGSNNIAVVVGNGNYAHIKNNGQITTSHSPKINYGIDCSIYALYYPEIVDRNIAIQELAIWINNDLKFVRKIILHGYSQYALDFLTAHHWLNKWSQLRLHIVAVSAPVKNIPEDTFKAIYKKLDCHIVVSKSFLYNNQVVPFQDQIPPYGIHDQVTAYSAKSAMNKSCKFVKALM